MRIMQYIKKEVYFGLRNSKFLILIIGFLFFAVLTPVMTKVILPEVLKSQFPGMTQETLSEMLDMTQRGCIRSYMGDVFEIGTLIVVFTLCGVMAQEIKENTLVLPLCSGKQFGGITAAKMIVFGSVLVLSPTFALLIDYMYSGVLFSFEIGIAPIIRGGLLQGFFMVFVLTCLIMFGTWIKKPIPTGFVTLAFVYGLHFLGGTLKINNYLPSGLLAEAQQLAVIPAASLTQTLFVTTGIILLLISITVIRLKSMEWNER